MPKILIAECIQEIASFNPVLSRYEDFDVSQGDAILDYHRGGHYEIGGAVCGFERRRGGEIMPAYSGPRNTTGGRPAPAHFRATAAEVPAPLPALAARGGVYV